ncbi:MAG: glycosyl transferase family protein [Candidatus Kaiserbacteria bacterium]|nr:glycosyl transferase family protein [Candidatus Kaiserbacteria bacterium]
MYDDIMETNVQGNKRIKILYIITKSNFGGAQRYIYDLATALPKDTFDVVVAYGGTGIPGSDKGQLATLLEKASIRTLYIAALGRDVSLKNDWSALKELITICKQERPQVLHLNSSKVGGLGALAGRIAGVPRIIFTAHGWPFWEKRSALTLFFIRIISWLTVLLSHKTICISDFDAKNINWMKGVKRKITVIRNGISLFPLLPRIQARNTLFSPEVQRLHTDDFWLISNGELHKNKNYISAISAVMQYNNTHERKIFYSIMGEGERKYEIENYIAKHAQQQVVHLLGFVPEGRQYMPAFDGFFIPSIKEGMPYVILESGLAKLPVIASNVGGIPEVITDHKTGLLVNSIHVTDMVGALETLVQDADVRLLLSTQLYDRVATNYSLERMVDKTTELYTS